MLVLFDIDDTLLNHRAAERAAARALHDDIGRPGAPETFLSTWSTTLEHHYARYLRGELSFEAQRRARIRDVVDARLTDAEADRMLDDYRDRYEAQLALFPDVPGCLDRLTEAGHALGIISNGPSVQQRQKLERTGVIDRFSCLIISEEFGRAKPDASIFLGACAVSGVTPDGAVYVGDRYDIDAEGARRAGLRGIWLDRYGTATAAHTPPIIRSLDELYGLIDAEATLCV